MLGLAKLIETKEQPEEEKGEKNGEKKASWRGCVKRKGRRSYNMRAG